MNDVIDFLSRRYTDFEVVRKQRDGRSVERSDDGSRNDHILKAELAVRVFRDGRAGFAYGSGETVDTGLLEQNLNYSIENSSGDRDMALPPASFTDGTVYGGERFIDEPAALDGIASEMLDEARRRPLLQKVERVTVNAESETIAIYNSRCGMAIQKSCRYAAAAVLLAARDNESRMEWDFAVADTLGALNGRQVVDKAYERALKLLNATPVRSGRYTVLLENRAACDFLEVLAPSFVGENIFKKRTILTEGICFSEKLNIYDDPAVKGGGISFYLDGEGIGGRKKNVVERGRVKGPLLDSFYGRKHNAGSTGNSIRSSMSVPPKNGCSNIWIEGGVKGPMGNALAATEKVLAAISLIGMHLVNPVTGEISVGLEGYLLDKGEYSHGVSQVSLSGNLKEMYCNILELGDDFSFYGQVGSPSLLVEGLTISGT